MTAKDCFIVNPGNPLHGRTTVPGDKSISHRSVMFGALAQGVTQVRGWLAAGDTEASLASIQALGIQVDRHSKNELTIHGGQFLPPKAALNLVNASIRYSSADDHWSAGVYGRNLADKKYFTQKLDFGVFVLAGVGPPREYGVDFTYKW